MKPLIGMTASLEPSTIQVNKDNNEAIVQAGGLPIIIPFLEDESVQQIVSKLDGLLLTGGGDIDPFLFGEEPHRNLGSIQPQRDQVEVTLIQYMLAAGKPILGICRGCQILNIAAGGNMYQDIYTQLHADLLQHSQIAPRDHVSHYVHIKNHTLLYRIVNDEKIKVNSYHHQAVKDLAPGFVVSGTSTDGVIESFESSKHRFVIGVQWHPENLIYSHQSAQRLFQAFIEACKM